MEERIVAANELKVLSLNYLIIIQRTNNDGECKKTHIDY